MIDTMRIIAPLAHADAVHGGIFMALTEDGEIEWERARFRQLEGSFDNRLSVWTESPGFIGFEGSPSKWFQGHNIFGSDDLIGLAAETLLDIARVLDIEPTASEVRQWFAGEFTVRRADVTYSFQLRNRSDVLAYIRAMEHSATMSHRGRGQIVKGDTLYFGKQSRRWSFKFYSKGQELNDHKLPYELHSTSLPSCADGLLRSELVLRSMELKKLGLNNGKDWKDETPLEIHELKLGKLDMPDHVELATDELEALPSRLRAVYELHQKGMDTRQLYARRTWYRYRNQLKKYGIDLSANIGNAQEHANVVKFRRTLVAERVWDVPAWAVGTNMYFEPRQNRNAS